MVLIYLCLTSSSVRYVIKNGFITASKPNAMLYLIIDFKTILEHAVTLLVMHCFCLHYLAL